MREGSPPDTCQVSGVTCHVSHVTCHLSNVTCQIFFLVGQSGEASQGRVCYQRGLPRLVYIGASKPGLLFVKSKFIIALQEEECKARWSDACKRRGLWHGVLGVWPGVFLEQNE